MHLPFLTLILLPVTFFFLIFFSGYFTDKGSAYIATMREGLKLSRKLANSESFNKYKGEEVFPGKHIQSDDELDAYIRDVRTVRVPSHDTFLVFMIHFLIFHLNFLSKCLNSDCLV